MTIDPTIEASIYLSQQPFDFDIKRRRGKGVVNVTVSLYPLLGNPVEATGPTFAQAYTRALNQMKRSQLVNHVDEMADYDATIDAFLQGTGRL